jgi:hypothetical protein
MPALAAQSVARNGCQFRSFDFAPARRFAQDFACGLPLSFASLTPANRLNFAKIYW